MMRFSSRRSFRFTGRLLAVLVLILSFSVMSYALAPPGMDEKTLAEMERKAELQQWRKIVVNRSLPRSQRSQALQWLVREEAYDDMRSILEREDLEFEFQRNIVTRLYKRGGMLQDLIRNPKVPLNTKDHALTVLGQNHEYALLQACVRDKGLPVSLRLTAVDCLLLFGSALPPATLFKPLVPAMDDLMRSESQWVDYEHASQIITALQRANALESLIQIARNQAVRYHLRAEAIQALREHAVDLFAEGPPLPQPLMQEALAAYAAAVGSEIAVQMLVKLFSGADFSGQSLAPEDRLNLLNRALEIQGPSIGIIVLQVSHIRAARGLIHAMQWGPDIAEILYDMDMDDAFVAREFPGYVAAKYDEEDPSDQVRIFFQDIRAPSKRTDSSIFEIPMTPFKFSFPTVPSDAFSAQLRRELNPGHRKIIVAGHPKQKTWMSFCALTVNRGRERKGRFSSLCPARRPR